MTDTADKLRAIRTIVDTVIDLLEEVAAVDRSEATMEAHDVAITNVLLMVEGYRRLLACYEQEATAADQDDVRIARAWLSSFDAAAALGEAEGVAEYKATRAAQSAGLVH